MKNKYERIIKRPDGSRVKITAAFDPGNRYGEFEYNAVVEVCAPGKRKFSEPVTETYDYRKMSLDERRLYRQQQYLTVATADEIISVKMELWRTLRPVPER